MRLVDGLLLGWALAASGFTLVALARLARHAWLARRRPSTPRSGFWPPVLLLRPVDAPTRHECSLWGHAIDYPGELEQVVVSPRRGQLCRRIRWLRSTPTSPNRKVGHLAFAVSTLPTEGRMVLSVDADVQVDGALVCALVEALSAGAALASAPPEPEGPPSLAGWLWRGLLVHSHHSFAALGLMRAGPPALCGKAIALGAPALAELAALGELLGEDLELASRLHRQGQRVVTVATSALCPLALEAGVALTAVRRRATRWARVLLAHRPGRAATVPLLLAPTPLLWLAVAVRPAAALLAAVVLLTALRTVLAACLGCLSRRRRVAGWLAWAPAEALQLAALGMALLGGPLAWRGRTFRLAPGGRLVPIDGGAR
jgi:hypothetical protein